MRLPTITIYETSSFTEIWREYFGSDDNYAAFQMHLALNPEAGSPIPGAGRCRKIRWHQPHRGKGKRGGVRVIYFVVLDVNTLVLLDVYDHEDKEDLTPLEKKAAGKVADEIVELLRSGRW